ncbi:MAG: cob(I)yrinic acid a,c-diamide adenosyltransferase [Thermoanaerobaculia bacterium]
MPRITRVTTRTGDDGSTSLGDGSRLAKDALRVAAYGTVDELNSVLGWAIASSLPAELRPTLTRLQNDLFHLGSDLCLPRGKPGSRPVPRIEPRHLEALDEVIDSWLGRLAPLANFVLPGGTAAAAALHLARTVCRRAERLVVSLAREEDLGAEVLPYLNRLSDALFVLARAANHLAGEPDLTWDSRL